MRKSKTKVSKAIRKKRHKAIMSKDDETLIAGKVNLNIRHENDTD